MTKWRYQKAGKEPPAGKTPDDVIILPALNTMANERTGSPDQKPIALYEWIVKASSNEGDLVLDPFCGCATTIMAAENLNRRWVGIDRRVDARYHIITRMMGITRKERARIEKFAKDNTEWLERQTQKFEFRFRTEPPVRTDNTQGTTPELSPVYHAPPERLHTHAEMKDILIRKFGTACWGCGFDNRDERYLQLDHISPKTDGGANSIDNRALLCQPCNVFKGNRKSLSELRRENKRKKYMKGGLIDLIQAREWTREVLIAKVRETDKTQK